jgi:SNF2 family DNA or RNA helicase
MFSSSKEASCRSNFCLIPHSCLPLLNTLPEPWVLLNFVLPKAFNSFKLFDEWFNTPLANSGTGDIGQTHTMYKRACYKGGFDNKSTQ